MHENIVLYMKRRVITLLMLSLSVSMMAQMKWNQSYQQYFDQYKDLAIEQMMKYRIPASITLAQGVFESGAGKSELARRGNNHFGIKCHGWRGAKTYHTDDAPNECFRAYKNVYESYEDHSKFLANGRRYSNLFRLKITDYKGWLRHGQELRQVLCPPRQRPGCQRHTARHICIQRQLLHKGAPWRHVQQPCRRA